MGALLRLLVALTGVSLLAPWLVATPAQAEPTRALAALSSVGPGAPLASSASLALGAPVTPRPTDTPRLPPSCFGPAQEEGDIRPCPIGEQRPGRPTLMLWGDSHAHQWIPALRRARKGERVNVVSFVAGACPPMAVAFTPRRGYTGKCAKSNAIALRYVRKMHGASDDFTVLLGSHWSGYRRAYRQIVRQGRADEYDPFVREMVRLSHAATPRLFTKLGEIGVRVAVLAQAATVPADAPACDAGRVPYLCSLDRGLALPNEVREDRWLARRIKGLAGRTRVVDARPAYCDAAVCHGTVGRIATWSDDLHLSTALTRSLAPYLAPVFRDLHR